MGVVFRDFFPQLDDKTIQENPYDELAISAVKLHESCPGSQVLPCKISSDAHHNAHSQKEL